MDDDLIIGARKGKVILKQNLNIERFYSIENFKSYILNFDSSKLENIIKNLHFENIN